MEHLYGCGSNGEEITFDKKTADNPNSLIIGSAGAGKYHIVKNEIVSNLIHGDSEDKIIIVDVYGEYRNFAKEHGGEIVDFTNTFINPCDTADYLGSISKMFSFLTSFIEIAAEKEFSAYQKEIIGRVCEAMYEPYTITFDLESTTTVRRNECPTLADFCDRLTSFGKGADELLTVLRPLCRKFAHRTNVKSNSRLTVIDLSSVSERRMTVALQASLMYIWSVMTENKSRSAYTWVYLEELHRYFRSNALATTLSDIFKRSGTQNGIITGISQYVDNNSEQSSRIFHCYTGNLILLSQNEAVAEQMKYLYNIPDNLIEYIKNVPACNGLIQFGRGDFIPFVQGLFKEKKTS